MTHRKVVVLGGGFSSERNVSLAGAANIAITLRKLDCEVSTVDPSTGLISLEEEIQYQQGAIANAPSLDELSRLKQNTNIPKLLLSEPIASADLIFPLIHGRFGEDGRLQAVLESANLAYVGSAYVGQALAMDKHLAKQLFVQNGIPTPPWTCLKRSESYSEEGTLLVKPVNGGSTVGMSICNGLDELDEAIRRAFEHDAQVIVEQFIKGREFTVGVLGSDVLSIGEIRSAALMFDYAAKYQASQTEEIFPADLGQSVVEEIRRLALRVCDVLHLRHYCRVDVIVDDSDQVFILEANAIPGMTKRSLFPQSAAAAGLTFEVVCERLCEMALRDR
jgi:D-alanine-D-alanine ligase